MKNRTNQSTIIRIILILTMLMVFSQVLLGTDYWVIERAMFADLDDRELTATIENADLLAPTLYGKAFQNYQKAENELTKGKNLGEVRRLIDVSLKQYEEAIQATYFARLVFGATLQARGDAVAADAPLLQLKSWIQAEAIFKEAVTILENNNLQNAKKKAETAEKLYREAELEAIKKYYLLEAQDIIGKAEKLKGAKLAPKSLQRAKNLAKEAEELLDSDRYDTDQPRILAKQAKREAKHALYLTQIIQKINDQKISLEDILIASEAPLKRVANSMNFNLSYEEGFNKSTKEILDAIDTQKVQNMNFKNELFDSRHRNAKLLGHITALESRLGITEAERNTLAKQIDAQARVKARYDAIQKLFTNEEAVILREGQGLRIRLTGLSFAVGKAEIETQYYSFLSKVLQAVNYFPSAGLIIEGHTDAFGSDALNLKLSQDRAENVLKYLQTNGKLSTDYLQAIGYGESRPIATNETEEGRARNRRIAVVIHPHNSEDM